MADIPTRTLPAVRQIGPHPHYRRIQSWLKTCSSSHIKCRPDWWEDLVKLRAIDVRRRSIVPLPAHTSYLALSYVWGRVSQPSLPVATETLPFQLPSKLPKTIRHAMRVTRKLGFNYLWVDSVCIDQSSPEDKATQLDLMDRIYQGAYATIVALGSPNANAGLCRVGKEKTQARQTPVFHQGAVQYLSFLPTLREELDRSTWMQRGWTYQEGLLSNRCIFFGHNQVYFACNEMGISEDTDGENMRSRNLKGPKSEEFHQNQALVNPLKSYVVETRSPSAVFNSMIREYTNRKLTNEEDTLDAVSGVLRLLKESILPKGFLFGLPLNLFRSALLWTHSSSSPLRRCEVDCFPSWSWASWHLESPICIPDEIDDDYAHVQPPLKIRHLDNWIEWEPRRVYATRKHGRGTTMLKRLQSLYETTTKMLSGCKDVPLSTTHNGLLYVQGIVLRLPCSQVLVQPSPSSRHREPWLQFGSKSLDTSRREQVFYISQEALLLAVHNNVKYDVLLVSAETMCIDSIDARLVSLHFLILGWTNGVARRIGVAKILFSEDELVNLWPECDACYRGFWLG
ncbi:heterokaryon incompatibility protein-domain-containing protein [Pyrenochaeta sp. MPI-SDFR-AT-0127]|nr:heterokaryon incompatibility protein-domain-containing protein [Pyrenochaeta sp. MPI-SDFR-AT-0127]